MKLMMRLNTRQLLLTSAILLSSQLSVAYADGSSQNPWSPSYHPPHYNTQQSQSGYAPAPEPQYQPRSRSRTQPHNFWQQSSPSQQAVRPPVNRFTRNPFPANRSSAFNRPAHNISNNHNYNNRWNNYNYNNRRGDRRGDRWGNHWNNPGNFWGHSGPGNWTSPNKQNISQGWDDMLNAPSRMGQMPGGWSAPSVSMPNPVNVSDQFKNNARRLPDQMRNMNMGN